MWFELAYTFLGGLGIFFYGMSLLSEGLQSLTGGFIRRVINTLTTNRLAAVGVGALVTTLVQSSSVTTVMVVGLVNAGLMELTQAIGVIMGANIGTTITGWIIAIKVGKYGLLFVGLGVFPLLFANRDTLKQVGRILVALGFVFMGLKFMSGAFKPLRNMDEFLAILKYFAADTYLTVLACVAVGAALTFIVQSSSAMLGITIALAITGVISFQTSVALVLGENIGTTITALLASIGGNTGAKRAARAHALFNCLGVAILVPFFWLYVRLVDGMIGGDPTAVGSDGELLYVAAHIAAAHTLFNVTNTIIFLPAIKYLAKIVTFITPASRKKEVNKFTFLPVNVDMAPSLALAAAEKEIINLSKKVLKVQDLTRDFVFSNELDERVAKRISRLEEVTDSIQTEVTVFLCRAQESRLTLEESSLAYAYIRVADEMESVADYCEALVKFRTRLETTGESFNKAEKAELKEFLDSVFRFYADVSKTFEQKDVWDLKKVEEDDKALTDMANTIRDAHRKRMEKGTHGPKAGMLFSDMIVALRKHKGHVVNIVEAMTPVAE